MTLGWNLRFFALINERRKKSQMERTRMENIMRKATIENWVKDETPHESFSGEDLNLKMNEWCTRSDL